MISILRTETPDYLDPSRRNLQKNDYSNNLVLQALLEMQHSKCCYCERRLTDLGSTERWVEHIKPQTEFVNADGEVDWNLANGWNNLLYSCATCNRKKGKTPLIVPNTNEHFLVEPSADNIDPEEHISFFVDGPLISHISINGSQIGQRTVNKLFKGRTELYKAFKKLKAVIDGSFADMAGAIASNDNGEYQSIITNLELLTCSKKNHTGFARSYLSRRVDEFNYSELPRLNNHFGTNFGEVHLNIVSGHTCLT